MSGHTYTVERLVHYRCGSCAKWWTIGDDPLPDQDFLAGFGPRQTRCCPWCGHGAGAVEVKK